MLWRLLLPLLIRFPRLLRFWLFWLPWLAGRLASFFAGADWCSWTFGAGLTAAGLPAPLAIERSLLASSEVTEDMWVLTSIPSFLAKLTRSLLGILSSLANS